MKDERKVKRMKFYVLSAIAVLLVMISYSLGGLGKVPKSQINSKVDQTKKVDLNTAKVDTSITQDKVEKFLIAYYTKKNLEENRPRYKPFMTDSMYQSMVAAEGAPVAQTYKDFVINQKFNDAKIYIDAENNTAVVKVNYSYVTLTTKNQKPSEGMKSTASATLLLSYQKSGKKFLVNQIQNVSFDDYSTDSGDSIKGQEAIYEQPESSSSEPESSSSAMPTAEERLGTQSSTTQPSSSETVEKPKTSEEK